MLIKGSRSPPSDDLEAETFLKMSNSKKHSQDPIGKFEFHFYSEIENNNP